MCSFYLVNSSSIIKRIFTYSNQSLGLLAPILSSQTKMSERLGQIFGFTSIKFINWLVVLHIEFIWIYFGNERGKKEENVESVHGGPSFPLQTYGPGTLWSASFRSLIPFSLLAFSFSQFVNYNFSRY